MIKVTSFVVFLFVTVTVLGQRMVHTEMSGRPTNHGITLQMIFADSAEVRVEWGNQSGNYTQSTSWQLFLPNTPAEFEISGLTINTQYFYRFNYRQPGQLNGTVRPEYSFHTQRPDSNTFTFIVQADPHLDNQSDTALYQLCLKNQLEDHPDFMIDLGDFLMSDKLKNANNQVPLDTIPFRCHLLRSYYDRIAHSVPLFIALGNHEGEAGWYRNGTAQSIPVVGTNERKKYFLNPYPNQFYSGDTSIQPYTGIRENYYSWTWGNALFVVLDPYYYTNVKPDSLNGWRWTLGKTQYDWLKETLKGSNATFKFVLAHQIIGGDPDGRGGVEFAHLYEWGGYNLNGTYGFTTERPGWYKPIKDLLEENRVTIFFHGHDHFFGKQDKDCLIYQETPQPSHPNFSSASQAAVYGYFQGQIQPNSGHLRVTVSPNGTRVDYVRAYLPKNENGSRHNKDVSATYYIGRVNCYDSLARGVPVLWNSDYSNELVYPNPFSHEVKIELNQKKADIVDIKIVNQNGQLVRQLVQKTAVPEGKYTLFWDGTTDSGHDAAPGIYFYQVYRKQTQSIKSGKLILTN
jgi:hypothetical protein